MKERGVVGRGKILRIGRAMINHACMRAGWRLTDVLLIYNGFWVSEVYNNKKRPWGCGGNPLMDASSMSM